MPNELKPCPFCGGEAVVILVRPFWMLKKYHNRFVAVGCKSCYNSTSLFNAYNKTGSQLLNEAHTKNAEQKAIEAWNRRVDNA